MYYKYLKLDDRFVSFVRDFFQTEIYPMHRLMSNITPNKEKDRSVIVTEFDIKGLNPVKFGYIAEMLPILSGRALVSEMQPGGYTSPHIDANDANGFRLASVNFPIIGCTAESPLNFYINNGGTLRDTPKRVSYPTNAEDLELQAQCVFDNTPVLLNTNTWHSVRNNSTYNRIIISLSVTDSVDFSSALAVLANKNLV